MLRFIFLIFLGQLLGGVFFNPKAFNFHQPGKHLGHRSGYGSRQTVVQICILKGRPLTNDTPVRVGLFIRHFTFLSSSIEFRLYRMYTN